MAVEYVVDFETQCNILDDKVITTELSEDEVNSIVKNIEIQICQNDLSSRKGFPTE